MKGKIMGGCMRSGLVGHEHIVQGQTNQIRSVSSYRDRMNPGTFFPASFFARRGELGVSSGDECVACGGACLEADLYSISMSM